MSKKNKKQAEKAKVNAGMSAAKMDNENGAAKVVDAVPSIGVQLLCRDKFQQGYKLMNLECKRSYLESLISENKVDVELKSKLIRLNREFIIDALSQDTGLGSEILAAACNLLSMQPQVETHLANHPDLSLGFSFKIRGNSEEETTVIDLDYVEWVQLTQLIS